MSITFKNCELLYCTPVTCTATILQYKKSREFINSQIQPKGAPETLATLYINYTSIKKKKKKGRAKQGIKNKQTNTKAEGLYYQ